jgi:hypothetical protein
MPNNDWETQRAEIATWLSGWSGMIKKWIDRILDNDDHDVDKNKIINIISEWIEYLNEMKIKIMKMNSTPIYKELNEIKLKQETKKNEI